MNYKAIIGLETHVQLNTHSKIFCSCKNQYGSDANTLTCPVCLGYPGVLPVLNREVVNKAIMVGLSLNCDINHVCKFDRKNYFYPDLPKGYQISQYDQPIAVGGALNIVINGLDKRIGITRAHIEEDTGKSIHGEEKGVPVSYIDFNRCGTPLLEIVTEPDMNSSDDAVEYLTRLRRILRYIGVSNCNMEEGSLRCDANISVMKEDAEVFGTKVEVKNMNSLKSIKNAIDYEIKRQIEVLENGGSIFQETRLWDADSNTSKTMRVKEGEDDYRYFPEPDLVPLNLDNDYIEKIKINLPELQDKKIERFKSVYQLPEYDIEVLTESKELADYYENAAKYYPKDYKKISNWIMSEVLAVLKEKHITISDFNVEAKQIAKLVELIDNGTISGKIAKNVFNIMKDKGGEPEAIINKLGLKQIDDESEIENIVKTVIEENPEEVEKYKSGKKNVIGFFVGQIMRQTKGKANPQIVNKLLRKKLDQQ